MPTGVYPRTEYHRRVIGKGQLGRKHKPEAIEKRAKKLRGQKRTLEQRINISTGTEKALAKPEMRRKLREKMLNHYKNNPNSTLGFQKGHKGFRKKKPRKTIKCKKCGKGIEIIITNKRKKFCSKSCHSSYKLLRKWEDTEFREKTIKNSLKGLMKRPTSFEQKIIDLINEHNLPFSYVGDGRVIINYVNPDFIGNNGNKQIIEVYYSWFKIYHLKKTIKQYERERRERFAKFGFTTLFLDENDLERDDWKYHCLNKIKNFGGR